MRVALAALTSFGTTSPRYMRQYACRVFHRQHKLQDRHDDLGHRLLLMTRGCGTSFVWNSVTSKFSVPSRCRGDFNEEMMYTSKQFKFMYVESDAQIVATNVVHRLVVHHDNVVRVLKKRVNAQGCVGTSDPRRPSRFADNPHREAEFFL